MAYLYIKMKPYLKEFLLGMETSDGEKLYGPEPVKFPLKDRIGQMVERFRRKPYNGKPVFRPESKDEFKQYLKVQVKINPSIKNDDQRLFISEENQTHIAKYIYELFCAVAFDYVRQHLYWQDQTFPFQRPKKSLAYRSFIDDWGLLSAEEDSIRKAVDRDPRTLPFEQTKKKSFEKKQRFQPKYSAIQPNIGEKFG